ncbi:hypothetical protein C8T65DRAFT_669776 [Cerioporus squamosus]|nr:hypothetical protein C8T65DRAFT_669776 [Cerioporus squamosus]
MSQSTAPSSTDVSIEDKQSIPGRKWRLLLAIWRKYSHQLTASCFCKTHSVEEIGEDHYGVRLRKSDDFKAFATAAATPGCPLQHPGSVQALAIRTSRDASVAEDALKKVAGALIIVQELHMVGLSRDSVETFWFAVPAETSIQYMLATYLPSSGFPCLASVTALETWDEIVHLGDDFRSLSHLKLHPEHGWPSVVAVSGGIRSVYAARLPLRLFRSLRTCAPSYLLPSVPPEPAISSGGRISLRASHPWRSGCDA